MLQFKGRLCLVLGAAAIPAVVAVAACNDTVHLPGLADELPNRVGSPVSLSSSATGTTGTGATTTTATGSSSSGAPIDAGPALSLCDCAEALNAASPNCKTCAATCSNAYTACMLAPANECATGIGCVMNCDGGPCIAACLEMNPAYTSYIDCLFGACAQQCGWSPPLVCPYDAGAGG